MGKDIILGAMAPPLTKQLEGLGLDEDFVNAVEQDAQALYRLRIRGVLSYAESQRAARRIVKSIQNEIKRVNGKLKK